MIRLSNYVIRDQNKNRFSNGPFAILELNTEMYAVYHRLRTNGNEKNGILCIALRSLLQT